MPANGRIVRCTADLCPLSVNRIMQALSTPNIESELSYAYLHAVASKAGMACSQGSRHEDNNGIDASLTAWGPFADGGYLTEVNIKVQLKATVYLPKLQIFTPEGLTRLAARLSRRDFPVYSTP